MKRFFWFLALTCMSGLLAPAAKAEIILVEYGFAGTQNTSTSPTILQSAAGLAVTNLSYTGVSRVKFDNNALALKGWTNNNAVDTSQYIGFTIGSTGATAYSVDSVNFQVNSKGAPSNGSNHGPNFLAIRSSLDGFSTNLGVFAFPHSGFNDVTFSLTSPQFTGLTTSTEFRVYGYQAGDTTKTNDIMEFGTNSFVVNGSTNLTVASAPEPATMGAFGLFGAAGAVGAWWKRRKKLAKK